MRGSYYQFGIEQSKEVVSSPLKEKRSFLPSFTAHANFRKAKKVLQHLSPNLFVELEGLAEGLEMSLDSVMKVYSGYDVEFPHMGCTTLINNGYCCVGFSQSLIGRLDGMN